MRVMAVIIMILGVASLALGVMFMIEAASAEQEVADSIAPLPLEQLDAQYDQVTAQYRQMRDAGTPPGADYNYLAIQKTGLGLARSNAGTASFVSTTGIINIILGLGVILAGVGLFKRSPA